jgi:hypothetical protein
LSALVSGSVPMTAPPVLCVLWYGTTLQVNLGAGLPMRVGFIALPIPPMTWAACLTRRCSLSLKSNVMRISG